MPQQYVANFYVNPAGMVSKIQQTMAGMASGVAWMDERMDWAQQEEQLSPEGQRQKISQAWPIAIQEPPTCGTI